MFELPNRRNRFMVGKKISLFKLFGFEVHVDWSWIIIVFLVTWSLARGILPSYYGGFSETTYWVLGVVGALGLFLSIIFHELCHSLVARRFGMPIKGITLFVFGGVAEMEEEPPNPKAELFMAAAGPLSSLALSGLFFGFHFLLKASGQAQHVTIVLDYLWKINLILAAFNTVPAYPLDGGRIFRAALWKWKNSLKWATRIASYFGSGFGFLLMFLGFLNIFRGALVGGIWWIVIGLFVRNASLMSYRKVIMLQGLKGEPVKRFMKTDVITVPADISVGELVEDYIYRHHYKMFPVVQNDSLLGCITTHEVKGIPRKDWNRTTVEQTMAPCTDENTISPDADATEALTSMNKNRQSRLMVLEGDRLVGIIALKDLLQFLALKMELEGEGKPPLVESGSDGDRI
jgi:Zn-dependent protease/predicted transcriptional regulator